MAGYTPFCKNVSDPVDALVSDLAHGEDLVPQTAAIAVQESPVPVPVAVDTSNRSHDIDVDDDDFERPDSLLLPDSPRSDEGTESPDNNRNQQEGQKRAKIYLLVAVLLIPVLVMVIVSLSGFYGEREYSNQRMKGLDSNTSYTRTNVYVLLKRFPCNDFCNVSEVKATMDSSTAEPDQVQIILTKCENVNHVTYEKNSELYSQVLQHANTPIAIIDENFVAKNHFRGNATIFAHRNVEKFTNQVYIYHFNDPFVFREFLSSKSHWKHFAKSTTDSLCIISGMHNTSYHLTTCTFYNEYPTFSFVGAVQSNPPQVIQFGFKVVGEIITGFTNANSTQTCTLNTYDYESECSIYVGNELACSAAGSDLCVLGIGLSAGDGHFQYTSTTVELIKSKTRINFTKTRIAFISAIVFVLMLLISILIAAGVCKCHTDKEQHVSAVEESESQRNRSMIAACNVQRQNLNYS